MLNNRGLTLIELMIVIALVSIMSVFLVIGSVVFMGNQWFNETGVLRELRFEHPEVQEVLKSERNVYSYSVITVKNKDGSISKWRLDTNVLFNYSFHLQK